MLQKFRISRRKTMALALALALALTMGGAALWPAASQAQALSKSALNLAMIAEPQTLDPMASTADLVGTIMQHVYEPLYTFDANWKMIPMLAEDMPKVSADGKHYSITLRKGVQLHNGRELNAEDVVASLKRWMDVSPRGKALAKEVADLSVNGAYGVELTLKAPYAPLLPQLALPSSSLSDLKRQNSFPECYKKRSTNVKITPVLIGNFEHVQLHSDRP